jgi:hypothetical protein
VIDVHYWLLDAAVEHGVHLPTLVAPRVGEILNRKPHGLPPDEIAAILALMLDDGDITLDGDLALPREANGFTGTQILDLMSNPGRCWYQLTERGGAEWEA